MTEIYRKYPTLYSENANIHGRAAQKRQCSDMLSDLTDSTEACSSDSQSTGSTGSTQQSTKSQSCKLSEKSLNQPKSHSCNHAKRRRAQEDWEIPSAAYPHIDDDELWRITGMSIVFSTVLSELEIELALHRVLER